jgi:hypothetical protein
VVTPVPVVVIPPGLLVNVHVPEEGKPLNATPPVATLQVGWVMVPITGAVGVAGCKSITTFDDDGEMQVAAFVTVKVYVPVVSPVIVVLVPVPVVVLPPGDLVSVHVPDDGKPLNATLPLARMHVGCVITPTTGAVGDTGWALITTLDDDTETQVEAFVTV